MDETPVGETRLSKCTNQDAIAVAQPVCNEDIEIDCYQSANGAQHPDRRVFARATPSRPTSDITKAKDERFRNLLGSVAWAQLPAPVRRRFSAAIPPGGAKLYAGNVVATELSLGGRTLALLGRLIGTPLPETNGAIGEAIVTVTEDSHFGGQVWTRIYGRPGRFPQVVHSAKRFTGPTGLEEYVGSGISMTLRVTVEDGALVFRSERYVLQIGGIRMTIPKVLSPGLMTIIHRQEPDNTFSFTLTLVHPVLGLLIRQLAYFRDV